jgi:hypothetical protein
MTQNDSRFKVFKSKLTRILGKNTIESGLNIEEDIYELF